MDWGRAPVAVVVVVVVAAAVDIVLEMAGTRFSIVRVVW